MRLNRYRGRQLLLLLTLSFLFFCAGNNVVAEEKQPTFKQMRGTTRPGSVTMNFKDVDIRVLIKFISELTGRNFLVDPGVKGKATILSPQKVTIDEAYKVFLSVLEINGYTTVPAGKIIKIIPSVAAKAKALETLREREARFPEDKVITQLIPLEYADAAGLAKLLRPLIPKAGLMISYPETNTLIIIDVLSNINRLISIINELDIPWDEEEINVFALEYARAEKLAPKLLNIFQKRKRVGKKTVITDTVKIIPDERTNSLVVLATAQTTSTIETLIQKLDIKQTRPRENIHIYFLQHAVAEDIAKVLLEIPAKASKSKKGKAPVLSREVQISADKATNSLVIIADPEEYLIIEGVIKKLDVYRTMVYVEALIMEVTASKALELGVEWRFGNVYDGGYGAEKKGGAWFGGSTGTGAGISSLAAGTLAPGFAVGVIGRGITLGENVFPTIGAFVQAVRTDSNFNILSTPQILTLDNEEAVIEVGQNIPFVTRLDEGTSEGDRSIQNIEYKDVGVTLKITPFINKKRFVRLKVEESVKSVVETSALGGTVLAPTTTFRTAKTTITVQDGETAVIGGLIENRMDRGKTQTPCLGSLPGLGWLFKSTSDRDEKTNLLVFLTPHIIENPEEGIDREIIRGREEEKPETLRKMGFE
ncbi:MAG: type II secretion system secretin GspD [Deltaproteobacteria bacterium]|nr:type II secretion system secretin GspD [Deltaproteobacteria bacterium]